MYDVLYIHSIDSILVAVVVFCCFFFSFLTEHAFISLISFVRWKIQGNIILIIWQFYKNKIKINKNIHGSRTQSVSQSVNSLDFIAKQAVCLKIYVLHLVEHLVLGRNSIYCKWIVWCQVKNNGINIISPTDSNEINDEKKGKRNCLCKHWKWNFLIYTFILMSIFRKMF